MPVSHVSSQLFSRLTSFLPDRLAPSASAPVRMGMGPPLGLVAVQSLDCWTMPRLPTAPKT